MEYYIYLIPLFIIAGAYMKRQHGGGFGDYFQKGLDLTILGMLTAICTAFLIGWWSILIGIWIPLMLSIPHGPILDVGRSPNNWKDWETRVKGTWMIVLDIFGKEDKTWTFERRWLRDATGWLLKGLFVVLVPSVLFIYLGYSWWFILTFPFMLVAYETGWQLKDRFGGDSIAYAELLYGALLYGSLSIYVWTVIN